MYMIAEVSQYVAVASFAEAWIEILLLLVMLHSLCKSPPSRRRGLKFCYIFLFSLILCRLLRGGVD